MAPKKRSAAELERLKSVSTRVTRSSAARLLHNRETDSVAVEAPKPVALPKKKQKKNDPKSKPAGETSAPKEETHLPKAESVVPKAESLVPKVDSPVASKEAVGGSKTIVIEHCNQCTRFKKRAVLVKEALEKDISRITVLVNPEKPRRGCFEVREEGGKGEVFISLLDMKRPFQPMTDLDMDQVIKNIIEKIK